MKYEGNRPAPKCNDFVLCELCKKCWFSDDDNERCMYFDSDMQLWLSGNEGDM